MTRHFLLPFGLIIFLLGAGPAGPTPPIAPLPPEIRALVVEVQDDFIPKPGTFVDIVSVVPSETNESIVKADGVYKTKKDTLAAKEIVLLARARVLEADHMRRGLMVVAAHHTKALEIISFIAQGGEVRARVVEELASGE